MAVRDGILAPLFMDRSGLAEGEKPDGKTQDKGEQCEGHISQTPTGMLDRELRQGNDRQDPNTHARRCDTDREPSMPLEFMGQKD